MITVEQYKSMSPFEQGYVQYSSKDDLDPRVDEGPDYKPGTTDMAMWLKGYARGIEEANTAPANKVGAEGNISGV